MSETCSLQIHSPKFNDARQSGFADLATRYLDHFSVPPGLMTIAHLYHPKLPLGIWATIAASTFTGEVHYEDLGKTEQGLSIVARVEAPVTQTRLVQWPLVVLADVVGDLSRYWRRVRERRDPQTVHHDHRTEWTLLAWIDVVVAQAHGFTRVGPAGMIYRRYDRDISSIGRFVSVTGCLPKDSTDLAILQVAAASLARKQPESFDPPLEGADVGDLQNS